MGTVAVSAMVMVPSLDISHLSPTSNGFVEYVRGENMHEYSRNVLLALNVFWRDASYPLAAKPVTESHP